MFHFEHVGNHGELKVSLQSFLQVLMDPIETILICTSYAQSVSGEPKRNEYKINT
jgi:hypothetical protein